MQNKINEILKKIREDKINEILKKIREANPELMKLEFGCWIKKPYQMFQNCGGYVCGVDRSDIYVRYGIPSVEETTAIFSRWDIKDEEILGKDPTLQDLLLCLIGKPDVVISLRGNYKSLFFNENQDNEQEYDLTKSLIQNLSENEELVDFIYSIICKEE